MNLTLAASDLFSFPIAAYQPATYHPGSVALPPTSLSATDWRNAALGALAVIQDESSQPDWDRPGTKAVAEETLVAARRLVQELYRLLPRFVPGPDIVAEADGEIDFSWYSADGRAVSLSVSPRRTVSFAANLGKKGVTHGWRPLEESVDEMVRLVVALFGSSPRGG